MKKARKEKRLEILHAESELNALSVHDRKCGSIKVCTFEMFNVKYMSNTERKCKPEECSGAKSITEEQIESTNLSFLRTQLLGRMSIQHIRFSQNIQASYT